MARGDLDSAAEYSIEHVVGMPPVAIEGFKAAAFWAGMRDAVTAFPSELRFLDSLTWQPGDLDAVVGAPVLLLGSETPDPPDALWPIASLKALLPSMQVVSIPGQGHVAHLFAPDLLAEIVVATATPG